MEFSHFGYILTAQLTDRTILGLAYHICVDGRHRPGVRVVLAAPITLTCLHIAEGSVAIWTPRRIWSVCIRRSVCSSECAECVLRARSIHQGLYNYCVFVAFDRLEVSAK